MKNSLHKGKNTKCINQKIYCGISGIYILFCCNTKNNWSATEKRNTIEHHSRGLSVKIKMFMTELKSQSISPARSTSQISYTQQ